MFSAKWWLVVALVALVLVAKFCYPQGGDGVKDVFFGETSDVVAVFGGGSWDE